jgi:Holliday junction resolvase RusA-like endonuclease
MTNKRILQPAVLAGEKKRSMTLVIDHLPPADLNPNRLRSIHWAKRSAVEKVAREEAYWLAVTQWNQSLPMLHVSVSATFTFKDKREHDLDNLLSASKPIFDGLTDAGVIAGDSYKHLEYGSIKGKQTGENKTIIEIQEV